MSELSSAPTEATVPFAAPPSVSPGSLLRQARQAQGLHVETLAASLKVPVAKLEALEADNFAVFPDANFVRAFAASVCRTLKIDAAEVLAAMPPGALPRLAHNSEGINTRLRDERSRSLFTVLGGKSITLAIFALLLGALLVFFLPQRSETEPEIPEEELSAPAPAPAARLDAEKTDHIPTPPPTVPTTPSVVVAPPTTTPTLALSQPQPATPQQLPLSPSPATVAASSSPQTAPAVSAEGVLVLSARASSWIHVRDAKGATVLQRTLASGESVTVTHSPPLWVTVGRADMTDVYVRGARFEIAALSRENVAKFEVK
ncbi:MULTISPECIES: helix-turn-helix domain-containing protein [Giesbergeria]|uniref:Helix-turn-helix domain-containing protein n=1 Tax=Giesbergeria sinuosa TaxID=80883 RepID=A0ABV9QD41_9BURK